MTEMAFETEIPVRFSDRDTLGHVNNALYATYLEEGRIAYLRNLFGEDYDARSIVIANLEIAFRASVTDRTVVVGVRPTDIGTRSFEMDYTIASGETLAATASTVQVRVDTETGDTKRLSDQWRDALGRDIATGSGSARPSGDEDAHEDDRAADDGGDSRNLREDEQG